MPPALARGGTGLRLSIAKQIVERLGEEMGFDDAPGGGSVFHVELPSLDGEPGWEVDLDAGTSAPRMLLCEDDREAVLIMREPLRLIGYAADLASTAAAAFDRAWDRVWSKAKSHLPAVARTVGFVLGRSKMLYLSVGVD